MLGSQPMEKKDAKHIHSSRRKISQVVQLLPSSSLRPSLSVPLSLSLSAFDTGDVMHSGQLCWLSCRSNMHPFHVLFGIAFRPNFESDSRQKRTAQKLHFDKLHWWHQPLRLAGPTTIVPDYPGRKQQENERLQLQGGATYTCQNGPAINNRYLTKIYTNDNKNYDITWHHALQTKVPTDMFVPPGRMPSGVQL